MSPAAIAFLSLSMSADAFAAAIARGAATRPTFAGAVRGGLVFGSVEAITPILGWAVGLAAASFVASIDHWIAFALLGGVGAHMIWQAFRPDEEGEEEAPPRSRGRNLLGLVVTAIGTSIDAGAVGVSLALVGVNILVIAASIGLATFVMTTIGLTIGRRAGHWLGSAAEIVGGMVLIVIGSFILAEHLGLLR
jgi:putative Mn2+ efflux pump MntP